MTTGQWALVLGVWAVLTLLVVAFFYGAGKWQDHKDYRSKDEDEESLEAWLERVRRIHQHDEAVARRQQEERTYGR